MSADFTPSMGSYHKQNAFKYWVQKVLPLVYDDSLSYYELLTKVVDYLNKTIEDVNQVIEDTEKLRDAYDKLQTWVNEFSEGLVNDWKEFRDFVTNYLQNLDVQEEINIKLDAMAEDGTLTELIRPFLESAVATQNQKISVLESRMDTFASLPDGSTTADAELKDIRVGADGTTYASAGDAVRGQVEKLQSGIDLINNGYYNYGVIANKYILRDTGAEANSDGWSATDYITVPPNALIIVYPHGVNFTWGAKYDSNKTYVEAYGWDGIAPSYYNDTGDYVYFRTSGKNEEMSALEVRVLSPTDRNLQNQGYPADAKAVGEQIEKLHNDIELTNSNYYSYGVIANKYILRDTGAEANSDGWSATNYIAVPSNALIIVYPHGVNFTWGAKYDSNKTYVEAYGWDGVAPSYYNDTGDYVYFRISGKNEAMSALEVQVLSPTDRNLQNQGYPADAKAVGDRLQALEGINDSVPDYYETQLATKETNIRGHYADCSYNGDGIVFLTDTHFSTDLFTSNNPTSAINANHSLALIKNVIGKTGIGTIVFGGDLVNSATDVSTMLLSMASFGAKFGNRQPRLRYCIGNHEYFTGADQGLTVKPTFSELYGGGIKYNENVILAKDDANTYYFDNALQKIRYFVIPCGRDTEVEASQASWVMSEFEKIPNDYKVVLIGHAFITDTMTAFRGQYKYILEAFDALKAKTQYWYAGVTYDYRSLNNVTPVCAITGHTHIDGSLTTSGGIPCICTTCDSYQLNYELVDGTPTASPRTKGTVDEQAFDVIQFDFTNKKIYCTRIGYGSDRVFTYV